MNNLPYTKYNFPFVSCLDCDVCVAIRLIARVPPAKSLITFICTLIIDRVRV